jgi:hypothetical protein
MAKPVYEDDPADLDRGIPDQTEEEAANEVAMNSPAARARRSVSDAENQIRANAVAKMASKTAPVMDDEAQVPAAKMPMRPGQASSGMTKTPMVTKEQLAASGLSLRDYLNKQQGLTRRDGTASARMPARPGQEAPISSNEGRNKMRPRSTGTVMDQGRGVDLYGGTIDDIKNMFKGTRRGGSGYEKGGAVKKMASGGSVSSASKRADGIAQRGKTKGKMC